MDRPSVDTGWAVHRAELVALGCLGLGLFLSFVLVAGAKGGVVGESFADLLAVLMGKLALVVPLALIVVAVALIFGARIRIASVLSWGVAAVFVGIALLVAAGFPPFGASHGAHLWVTEEYRSRAGFVGEALYGGGEALVGAAGVAIAAWLLLLAGLSLVTGITLRRMAGATGTVARSAGTRAEQASRRLRGPAPSEPPPRRPLDDPYLTGFGPPSRWGGGADGDVISAWEARPGVGSASARVYAGPEAPTARYAPAPVLLDGAAAFPDIYDEPVPGVPGAMIPFGGVSAPVVAEETREQEGRPGALGQGRGAEGDGGRDAEGAEEGVASGADPAEPTAVHPAAPDPRGSAEPDYVLPAPELLRKSAEPQIDSRPDDQTATVLIQTLASFGVDARVVGTVVGPRVTRFEFQLAPGTKVAKVAGLRDDLAYALASTEIRILAPIPGKQAVGVEVPNQRPSFVTLGDIYRAFPRTAGPLMVWLGKDISGKPVYTDLTKLPHLLIAGTTGSGKSGCVNCIISSILLRATPDLVRLILIDPKKVELSHYDRIPHLLVPVVTNMKNAAGVLHNVVKEMENRYELMELERARHLDEMNRTRARRGERPLPYLVVVIDELADLMMVAPAEVEEYVIRLAQKARAVGIHLVVATQRPSVDVITGMIKANIPSRIAFAVSSQTDSRVILDQNGAETLLGLGDMLFKPLGSTRLQRVQGAYITEEEIQLLVTHVRRQAEPEYREELLEAPTRGGGPDDESFDPDSDELLADAAEMVLETGSASVSMLQRRLRVGYTRAGRLIDMLERRGVVGPYEGSKPRQITVLPDERERVIEHLRLEARGGQLPLTEPVPDDLD